MGQFAGSVSCIDFKVRFCSFCIAQDTVTCSAHGSRERCVNNCGIGAPDGRCQWRQQSNAGRTADFSTCSPDLATCPDSVCDSLEQSYPRLCPQDCIGEVSQMNQIPSEQSMFCFVYTCLEWKCALTGKGENGLVPFLSKLIRARSWHNHEDIPALGALV